MAQWVYRIVPVRPDMVTDPTDGELELAAAHFDYAVQLRDQGILILGGRTQEEVGTFGIAVFEAPDRAEAERITMADPGIAGGLFAATVHPFSIAIARGGLFEE